MFHKIEILTYVMYTQLPIAHRNTLFCVRWHNIMEILYIRYIEVYSFAWGLHYKGTKREGCECTWLVQLT